MNDQETKLNTGVRDNGTGRHWDYFLASLMFYTRIPVPADAQHSDYILNKSRIYFPVVGWIIGMISVFTFMLTNHLLSNTIAILLSMVASVLATGAFHEDGFADSCDGLGGGWSTEQVLTIMKDSRVGTYAVVGLILLLGTKFLTLVELSESDLLLFSLIYISGHTVSRIFSSLVIEGLNYVQDVDKSKIRPIAKAKLDSAELCLSIVLAAIPVCVLLFLFPYLFFSICTAITGAALATFVFARYVAQRIGGYTGDVLGAIQQIAELFFYLIVLACL